MIKHYILTVLFISVFLSSAIAEDHIRYVVAYKMVWIRDINNKKLFQVPISTKVLMTDTINEEHPFVKLIKIEIINDDQTPQDLKGILTNNSQKIKRREGLWVNTKYLSEIPYQYCAPLLEEQNVEMKKKLRNKESRITEILSNNKQLRDQINEKNEQLAVYAKIEQKRIKIEKENIMLKKTIDEYKPLSSNYKELKEVNKNNLHSKQLLESQLSSMRYKFITVAIFIASIFLYIGYIVGKRSKIVL